MSHAEPPSVAPERRLSRENRREIASNRYLEAASRIVCREGIESLTFQRLADEMGSAVGAVYRYFPSKDAVLVALQGRAFSQLLDELQALESKVKGLTLSSGASALAIVVAMARHYQALPERDPAAFALIVQLLGTTRAILPPDAFLAAMTGASRLFDYLAASLEHAAGEHALSVGVSATRARVLFSGLHGALQLRKVSRFDQGEPTACELDADVINTLLIGWGAQVTTLKEAQGALRQLEET